MRRSTNYTEEEKAHALEVFYQEKSSSRARQILGYPSKEMLRQWVMAQNQPPKVPITKRKTQKATYEEKISAIHRCFELGEDLSLVANELGRHDTTIRSWYRAYIKEGPSVLIINLEEKRIQQKYHQIQTKMILQNLKSNFSKCNLKMIFCEKQ